MKTVLFAAALAVGFSAIAATPPMPTPISPELREAAVPKVRPRVAVLERRGGTVTLGVRVQVGVANACHRFAGYWWMDRPAAVEGEAAKRELRFATAIRAFPARPCAEIFRMEEVLVPIDLARSDEESATAVTFSIGDAGTFHLGYDWKSGRPSLKRESTTLD